MSAVVKERGTIRSRVPAEEYFSLPSMSISRLKEMRRSPQHYLHAIEHPKETPPLTLGRASHTAVLEPERFESQFAVWGERTASGRLRPRNGKDWDAFEAANAGKEILLVKEYELAHTIAKAVHHNPAAARYLDVMGDPEVTLEWTFGKRPCRARVDWLTKVYNGEPTLIGLKTARDCRHFAFASQAAKLGYHLQWAWYFDGYFEITGRNPKVVEIVVESAPPHAVAVYVIEEDVLDQGREENGKLLTRLQECERTGYFPGPQADGEEVLSLPSWTYNATDDLTDIGLEVA